MARRPATTLLRCALALAIAIGSTVAALVGASGAGGASSSTVVGATVPSATSLSIAGCPTGSAGRTHLGTVLPGSTSISTLDCAVTFGSSNDTARLRMFQADGGGDAMWGEPDGTLDGSLGTGGIATHAALGDTGWSTIEYAPGLNRYYVGGISNGQFLLGRLMPDGSYDTAFGGGDGWERYAMIGGTSDAVEDLAILADGRIAATGTVLDVFSSDSYDFGVLVVSALGVPDPGFGGGDGRVDFDLGADSGEWAPAIVEQTDGKLVACGTGGAMGTAFVARLTSTGALDTTFGNGDGSPGDGVTYLPTDPFGNCTDVHVAENGAIYGTGREQLATWQATVWKLLPDGTLDTSFGGDGEASIAGGDFDYVHEMHVDAAGTVTVAGETDLAGPNGAVVVRFTPTGAFDPGFGGGDGVLQILVPGATETDGADVLVLGNGTIFVTGLAIIGGSWDSFNARVLANGALDTTFNGDGIAVIDQSAPDHDWPAQMALGRDGRLVMVGVVDRATDVGGVYALAATPVSDYGAGATWAGAGEDAFGACLHAIGGGAVASGWVQDATCGATDGGWWQAVPDNAASGSLATVPSGTTGASVGLRFGFRTTTSQRPGAYLAPITFEVIAPQ